MDKKQLIVTWGMRGLIIFIFLFIISFGVLGDIITFLGFFFLFILVGLSFILMAKMNKKQLITAWTTFILMSLEFLILFPVVGMLNSGETLVLYGISISAPVLIIGCLLIYAFRDKKK